MLSYLPGPGEPLRGRPGDQGMDVLVSSEYGMNLRYFLTRTLRVRRILCFEKEASGGGWRSHQWSCPQCHLEEQLHPFKQVKGFMLPISWWLPIKVILRKFGYPAVHTF